MIFLDIENAIANKLHGVQTKYLRNTYINNVIFFESKYQVEQYTGYNKMKTTTAPTIRHSNNTTETTYTFI